MALKVSSDLYTLWSSTSGISTELFADCFNESGILNNYCSDDGEDAMFGAIGSWDEMETFVEGCGGHAPFNRQFIHRMMKAFDRGARGTSTYCRCVILPLGSSYGTMENLSKLCAKGILLVRIPPMSLPLHRQQDLLSLSHPFTIPNLEELGLFIWVNREYLEKTPPAHNVELLYFKWIYQVCKRPGQVQMYLSAFQEAFPDVLRSSNSDIVPTTSSDTST